MEMFRYEFIALIFLLCNSFRFSVEQSYDISSVEYISPSSNYQLCHQYDCPKFVPLQLSESFESRIYPSSKWALSNVVTSCYELATRRSFTRLFKYFSGNNSNNKRLNLTLPVVTAIESTKGNALYSNYTVGFYIPTSEQHFPPNPADKHIKLSWPKYNSTIAVRSFKGTPFTHRLRSELDKLLRRVQLEKLAFESNVWLVAAYNSPFDRKHDVHTEIWLIVYPDRQYNHDNITVDSMFHYDPSILHQEAERLRKIKQ